MMQQNLRQAPDHPIVPLVSLRARQPGHGHEHLLSARSMTIEQVARLWSRMESWIHGIWKNFHPSGVDSDPFEQAPSRIAAHRGDQSRRFHRLPIQSRQFLPSFDPVYLDPEPGVQELGDDGRQRRHEQVAAENDVNGPVCSLRPRARRASMPACLAREEAAERRKAAYPAALRLRAAGRSHRRSDHMPRARIGNHGCIARFRRARRMHRSPARELAAKTRPSRSRSGRRHLKGPAPRPGAFPGGKRGNLSPLLDALVALQPSWMGVVKPVFGRSITLGGSGTTWTVREQTLGLRPVSSQWPPPNGATISHRPAEPALRENGPCWPNRCRAAADCACRATIRARRLCQRRSAAGVSTRLQCSRSGFSRRRPKRAVSAPITDSSSQA